MDELAKQGLRFDGALSENVHIPLNTFMRKELSTCRKPKMTYDKHRVELRIKISHNTFCRSCKEEVEEKHYLCDCSALFSRRLMLVGGGYMLDSPIDKVAMADLVRFANVTNWI